jgi:hypothetical protein
MGAIGSAKSPSPPVPPPPSDVRGSGLERLGDPTGPPERRPNGERCGSANPPGGTEGNPLAVRRSAWPPNPDWADLRRRAVLWDKLWERWMRSPQNLFNYAIFELDIGGWCVRLGLNEHRAQADFNSLRRPPANTFSAAARRFSLLKSRPSRFSRGCRCKQHPGGLGRGARSRQSASAGQRKRQLSPQFAFWWGFRGWFAIRTRRSLMSCSSKRLGETASSPDFPDATAGRFNGLLIWAAGARRSVGLSPARNQLEDFHNRDRLRRRRG